MYHFLITRDFLRTLWFNRSYTSTVTDMQIYRLFCIGEDKAEIELAVISISKFQHFRTSRADARGIYACTGPRHYFSSFPPAFARCREMQLLRNVTNVTNTRPRRESTAVSVIQLRIHRFTRVSPLRSPRAQREYRPEKKYSCMKLQSVSIPAATFPSNGASS